MELQNVTISLPSDVLRKARHMAVDQGISLSKFVALVVEEKVSSAQRYEAAREQQIRLMREGLDLGTGGEITWSRDELHER